MGSATETLFQNIKKLVMQPNYPCVSAVSSFLKQDYMSANYPDFGSGAAGARLYTDLLRFKNEQRRLKAPFYSFWAVYEDSHVTSEEDFEKKLWQELSAVHAHEFKLCEQEGREMKWDPHFSRDPADKKFCFCVEGDAYFVVGMHPLSSRKARRFPYPALIFNLYAQFDELFQKGTFEPMAKINRQREIKFDGGVNPMVEKHGQNWESIQFSGKNNDDQWGCPFHRLWKKVTG
jgi:FPC/CPF motif-containing protein YcgG